MSRVLFRHGNVTIRPLGIITIYYKNNLSSRFCFRIDIVYCVINATQTRLLTKYLNFTMLSFRTKTIETKISVDWRLARKQTKQQSRVVVCILCISKSATSLTFFASTLIKNRLFLQKCDCGFEIHGLQ